MYIYIYIYRVGRSRCWRAPDRRASSREAVSNCQSGGGIRGQQLPSGRGYQGCKAHGHLKGVRLMDVTGV